MRRLWSTLAKASAAALIALVAVEIAFRLASGLVTVDRGDQDLDDRHLVVLCVGDSHTWGRGAGYPARLAARLAERSDRYRVINLGVPGTNTAQLRKRFSDYLDEYEPKLVVMWAGINNSWNQSDTELWSESGAPQGSWWSRLLQRSRLFRLITVWRREAELNRALERTESTYVVPDATLSADKNAWSDHQRSLFGREETFHNRGGGKVEAEQIERVTALDVGLMAAEAKRRGIPFVVITYSIGEPKVLAANEGLRRGAESGGALVIESGEAFRRLRARLDETGQQGTKLFDSTAHPVQLLYDEIGDLTLERLEERQALPSAGEEPAAKPAADAIRIMPLGDSITSKWGKASHRYWLYASLQKAGYREIDLVGGETDPWGEGFDPEHEGHDNWTAEEILRGNPKQPEKGNVTDWSERHPADVVLLQVGTNDLMRRVCALNGEKCTAEEQRARFAEGSRTARDATSKVIDVLRERNPNVAIAVAEVLPNVWVPDDEIRRYNAEALASLVREKSTDASPVALVALHDVMDWKLKSPDRDTNDGVHLNFNGARKAAERYHEVLVKELLPRARRSTTSAVSERAPS